MTEELEVLTTVTRRLAGAGIPYMVTGSMAVNFYAVPRMTRDIDLGGGPDGARRGSRERAVSPRFLRRSEAVRRSIRARASFNIIHRASVIKVDCMVRKESEYRRHEFERRRGVSVEGLRVFIVAPEDLSVSKLDWARDTRSATQLADVRNLLASVPELDRTYLAHWTSRLGLADLYREASA